MLVNEAGAPYIIARHSVKHWYILFQVDHLLSSALWACVSHVDACMHKRLVKNVSVFPGTSIHEAIRDRAQ